MSKKKPTPGDRPKRKAEISLVRSSAAEYLTFVAAGGDSEASVEMAKAHAESEFEKYRIVQDRLFESDFDKLIKQLPEKGDEP